jgi:hypothetical protein
MSDVLIVSCRLCLQPDELTSMVTIDRLLSNPPRTVTVSVCRPCAREIAGMMIVIDYEEGREVTNNAPDGSHSSRGTADDPAPAPTVAAVVPENKRRREAADLDRPEPEVPAGGADGERASEKG